MSPTGPLSVAYDPRALKELTKLEKPIARRIVKAVDALGADPRPGGVRPLVGYSNLWRIRVGDYRVVYTTGTMSSRFSYFELLTEAVSTAISDTTYEQVVACSEPRRTKVHR